MIGWCIEKQLPVSVFGALWEGLIPSHLIKGQFVPNDEVATLYSRAGVVLNDHWETMARNGFLSNRLFDASAAGASLITDEVAGLAEVFGDTIVMARDADELVRQVEAALGNRAAALARAERARQIVLASHTFDARAERIIEIVERLVHTRRLGFTPTDRTRSPASSTEADADVARLRMQT